MLLGEAASGAGGGPRAGGGLRAVLSGAQSREALLRLALEDTVAINCFRMPDFFKKRLTGSMKHIQWKVPHRDTVTEYI